MRIYLLFVRAISTLTLIPPLPVTKCCYKECWDLSQNPLTVTRHLRSHYVIEIFYIMKIILFAYFGLKFFSFWKNEIWWPRFCGAQGFHTLVFLDPFIKGSPPTFSIHQQDKYIVYSIPFLPRLLRESLRVVISNRSFETNHVLFQIVDCFVTIAVSGFFRIGFPCKSCILYCSCYRCLLLIIVIYPNASAISLL